ncbi:MAG: HEPN domain-containing protein [Terriglobia bacterium]
MALFSGGVAPGYYIVPLRGDSNAMNDVAQAWLRKSKDNLDSADILRNHGTPSGTLDRAYFAMFDAAKAMGAAEGKDYPPCSKWLDVFGEVFVETGRIERDLFDDLREAYRLRKLDVYGTREEDLIPRDVAESVFLKAAYFVAKAEEFLKAAGGELELGQST